jgi:hypothetical protein
MGTAIHAAIEEAIGHIDPEGKEYLVETEVAYGDMKAHVDLFVPETGAVIDWKTSKVEEPFILPIKATALAGAGLRLSTI